MIIVLLCLFEVICAQTTKVYGNLGVENVNISVLNTQYGTSSDGKGHYELPIYDRSKQVNLYYSCIGYQDTIVSLTPKQLERDSINISFGMRTQDYSLQEVGVTASRDFYRSKRGRNITDMAFLGDDIYLLENKPKTSSVVVLDSEGTEKAHADYDKLYEKLYVDGFHNMILVGQDSCLQIYLKFIKDGVNYLGLYDSKNGTVGMGSKACKGAYPKVFKVNAGYAYSVFWDGYRNQGGD